MHFVSSHSLFLGIATTGVINYFLGFACAFLFFKPVDRRPRSKVKFKKVV